VESFIACSDGRAPQIEFLTDISMGGAGIDTTEAWPIGTMVTMFFPSAPAVKVQGIVRRIQQKGILYRIGIEFGELTPEQRECLSRIMGALPDTPDPRP